MHFLSVKSQEKKWTGFHAKFSSSAFLSSLYEQGKKLAGKEAGKVVLSFNFSSSAFLSEMPCAS